MALAQWLYCYLITLLHYFNFSRHFIRTKQRFKEVKQNLKGVHLNYSSDYQSPDTYKFI